MGQLKADTCCGFVPMPQSSAEASLPVVLVCSVIALAMLWATWKAGRLRTHPAEPIPLF